MNKEMVEQSQQKSVEVTSHHQSRSSESSPGFSLVLFSRFIKMGLSINLMYVCPNHTEFRLR